MNVGLPAVSMLYCFYVLGTFLKWLIFLCLC